MNRFLAIFGALVLTAARPAVTLGAPPGAQAHARSVAPAPHAGTRSALAGRGDFKVPFDVDLPPKPLAVPQHFKVQSWAGFNPRATADPWYPALYGSGCHASNTYVTPSEQQPPEFTIGSLVDGKSKLFLPPHDAGLTQGKNSGAASSSTPKLETLQAGFYPTACGAATFTSL